MTSWGLALLPEGAMKRPVRERAFPTTTVEEPSMKMHSGRGTGPAAERSVRARARRQRRPCQGRTASSVVRRDGRGLRLAAGVGRE